MLPTSLIFRLNALLPTSLISLQQVHCTMFCSASMPFYPLPSFSASMPFYPLPSFASNRCIVRCFAPPQCPSTHFPHFPPQCPSTHFPHFPPTGALYDVLLRLNALAGECNTLKRPYNSLINIYIIY
jgi:hypothetical protein